MRIGVVLGAGGTSGGVFIRAAIAALEAQTGWPAASAVTVVGTSAGAINGARLASDAPPTRPEHLAALERLAERLAPGAPTIGDRIVAPVRRFGGRALARFGPAGRHPAGYEVASPPFHPGLRVVSVARPGGDRRVTRLIDAEHPSAELYASAAVPGASEPVTIDGRVYIDGAVHSPTNADLIDPDHHDLLVVIAPMVPLDGGSPVARSHRSLLRTEVRPWLRADKPVLLIAPSGADMAHRAGDHDAFGAAATARVAAAAVTSH